MCQVAAESNQSDTQTFDFDPFRDPEEFDPGVYLRDTVLHGTSLGSDQQSTTGTLGFFLEHDEDVYAISNLPIMVLDDQESGKIDDPKPEAEPYSYRDGDPKVTIHSPSTRD